MAKLKNLLSEVFEDIRKVDKHRVIEGVRNYGIVGKQLYNNSNIMEVAKQLAQVAESAHNHILGEQDDWFDKISVNRNMKALKGNVMEFQKTAKESHALNQRLTSLYEDIGNVLNRYYEITEDSGDMDGDGLKEPDDEEYLDNKRNAITKAVKGEAVGDTDNRDMVDRPSSPKKDAEDNEMTEAASDNPSGETDPDGPDNPAGDAEEMKEAIKQTQKNINKRPTRRLKDISLVSLSPVGMFKKSGK